MHTFFEASILRGMTDQSVAERNARLDDLLDAAKQWGDTRKKQLTDAVILSKAVLRGRTGSERLAAATVDATAAKVVEAIDDFLRT